MSDRVHKAEPSENFWNKCATCGQWIKKVPGGQGPTWVHEDSGAVAAPNPPADETYNGWKNRETWAFNLHWSNDRGLYEETLERAREYLKYSNEEATDLELGEHIVGYWKDYIEEYADDFGAPAPEGLQMFYREVGSWWRVDEAETGASVREALS